VLREGLRAEIPAVFDLAARARRPSVHRMTPALAALGALGVESLTSASIHSVQGVSVFLFGVFPFRSAEPITVAAYGLGTLFAFGSARWRGVAAAVILFAILWIEQFGLSIPARQTFCQLSGTTCDLWALAFAGLWPQLVGVVLGILAGRAVHQGAPGISALVLGVGVGSLAFPVARLAIVPFVGANPTGPSAYEALNWIIAAQALGAAALGLVVGLFGRWRVADAIVIGIFYLGPWLPQLRTFQDVPRPFALAVDWMLMTPVLYAAVALIALLISSIAPRYFATSTPTIP